MQIARTLAPTLFLFAGCIATFAQDTDADADGAAMDDVRETLRPIVELFGEEIPETLAPYNLELSIDPKFRDVISEDYVRLPARLTYGVNDHIDAYVELLSYFPSPSGDGGGTGIAETNFGAKYAWGDRAPRHYDLATGFDFIMPTPDVPYEISDGYVRFRPYVSIARWLDERQTLRAFSNLFFEPVIMQRTGTHHDVERFAHNNAGLSVGLIYHYENLRPVITAFYRTEISDTNSYHWYVEPGLVWDVPERYTHWLPGRWTVGAFYRYGEKLGFDDSGIKFRVSWRFDLGRWTKGGDGD